MGRIWIRIPTGRRRTGESIRSRRVVARDPRRLRMIDRLMTSGRGRGPLGRGLMRSLRGFIGGRAPLIGMEIVRSHCHSRREVCMVGSGFVGLRVCRCHGGMGVRRGGGRVVGRKVVRPRRWRAIQWEEEEATMVLAQMSGDQ